jgi:hypothetical protein
MPCIGIAANAHVIASDLRMIPTLTRAGTPAMEGPYAYLDRSQAQQLAELERQHEFGPIYHAAALLSAAAQSKPQVAWSLNMDNL